MANETILTDDYVAELLAKDATERSTKYSTLGLEAYRSTKPGNKAKPNTRFLENIIKSTENHNAALLAKEAAESQARLNDLTQAQEKKQRRYKPDANDTRRRQLGAISAILSGKRKRGDEVEFEEISDSGFGKLDKSNSSGKHSRREKKARGDDRGESSSKYSRRDDRSTSENRRHRDRSRSPSRREERESRKRSPISSKRRRGSPESDQADKGGAVAPLPEDDLTGRVLGRRKEKEQGRSTRSSARKGSLMDQILSNRKDRQRRHGASEDVQEDDHKTRLHSHRMDRDRSSGSHDLLQRQASSRESRGRLAEEGDHDENVDDDSDPLDEYIGPAPTVRARGRGTASGSSAMDGRFSSDYDPKSDVAMEPDEADNWDEAVEAFRDHQKWRQQGADRLRTAGFTDEDIKKWEQGGEKSELDVRWSKKGERREWDKGKQVNSDGSTKLAPEWTK